MQVFAQQAGQLIQIFPKLSAAIFRLVPAIAVLSPFGLSNHGPWTGRTPAA